MDVYGVKDVYKKKVIELKKHKNNGINFVH